MSEDRPLWLLDVNGVLNANKPGWGTAPRRTRIYVSGGRDYLVRWAPALIIRICGLLDSVEIQWASSWIGDTARLAPVLGLPDFESAYRPERHWLQADHALAKARVAYDVALSGRRLIWTDDDAIPTDPDYLSAFGPAGALLIAPRPNRGLQPAELDEIEAFLLPGSEQA